MSAAKDKKAASLSGAKSVEELGEHWDSHSLADSWGKTREARLEVRAARRRRVTIAPEVYAEIAAQAHRKGVSPETLVNLWLTEHIERG
jgi:hypothetical protein